MNTAKYKITVFTVLMIMQYFITIIQYLAYFPWYNIYKYITLLVTAFFLFKYMKVILNSCSKTMILMLMALSLVLLYSGIMNRSQITYRNTILTSLVFDISLFEMYFLLVYANQKERIRRLIKLYYRLTFFIIIVTDICVFFLPPINGEDYFVGNKFQVVYLHLYLIAFYLTNTYLTKNKFVHSFFYTLLCTVTIIISIIVDCTTGIIGIVLLMIGIYLKKTLIVFIYNVKTFVIALFLSNGFAVFYEFILANPYVQNFIVSTLNKSMTLTGRVYIYEKLPYILSTNFWLGNGYGSAYEVMRRFTPYSDAQNGLAQWIIQIGVVGTFFLIIIMIMSFSVERDNYSYSSAYAITILLYVFVVLSSIEITFNISFIFMIFLLFVINKTSDKNDCRYMIDRESY